VFAQCEPSFDEKCESSGPLPVGQGGFEDVLEIWRQTKNGVLSRFPSSLRMTIRLCCTALRKILRAQPDINVVAACGTDRAATDAIQQFAPDVAVLDIVMPDLNGLDVLSSIERQGFKTRVVILTGAATEDRVLAAMTRGAKGLLFKDAVPDDLVDCVREVAKGKLWFPNDPVGAAREHETGRQADSKCSIGELTPRERQITLLVSEGLADKLVAEQLNLAESTVKSHLHHIYKKLGIPNRTALSVLASTRRDG
jgi:two-component system, NarL family, nitrate/nitrite response regulator NarL